jgi:ankyrin repeat protein
MDEAIKYDSVKEVKRLIENYCDVKWLVNRKSKSGFTPLMMAAMYGRLEIIKILVEAGADVDVVDENNVSVLEWACPISISWNYCTSAHHSDVICYLIERSTFMNKIHYHAPLIYAAKTGNLKILNLLIERGVSVDPAFSHALKCGHRKFAHVLIHHILKNSKALNNDLIGVICEFI